MHAPCSVLLVPRAAPLWSRRIVACLDGTALGPVVALAAARVAAGAQLPLTIASVAAPGKPARTRGGGGDRRGGLARRRAGGQRTRKVSSSGAP